MDNFLLVLDQFRYIASLLVAERLFLINAAPRRKNFGFALLWAMVTASLRLCCIFPCRRSSCGSKTSWSWA